jgi:hypothetical protein
MLDTMYKIFSIIVNIVTIAWIFQQSNDANKTNKDKNRED